MKKKYIALTTLIIIILIGLFITYNDLKSEKENNKNIEINKTEKKISNIEIKKKQSKKIINYKEEKIDLSKKNIIIQDKTPDFYRNGDKIEIKEKIYNNTENKISLKIKFYSSNIEVNKNEKILIIPAKSNESLNFWLKSEINKNKDLKYQILALGNNLKNSDILEKTIKFKKYNDINSIYLKSGIAKHRTKQDLRIDIPENTDLKKSKVKITFSKNKIDNSISNFAFSIGYIQNRDKRFKIGNNKNKTLEREFFLNDIIQYKENYIELITFVISGKKINTKLKLEVIPKDKFKIKDISNGIKINRKFYEISNKQEIIKEIIPNDSGDYNLEFEKNKFYKVLINIETKNKNIILEDSLPSGFKVIKTGEKINTNWDNIEFLNDKIIANIKKSKNNKFSFEYIISPIYSGNFIYPPINTYVKDNLKIKASTKFEKIIVK